MRGWTDWLARWLRGLDPTPPYRLPTSSWGFESGFAEPRTPTPRTMARWRSLHHLPSLAWTEQGTPLRERQPRYGPATGALQCTSK